MRTRKQQVAQLIDEVMGARPYSSANIAKGEVNRRSYWGPYRINLKNGTSVSIRYNLKSEIGAEACDIMDRNAERHEKRLRAAFKKTGLNPHAVTVQWHIGATAYYSVRVLNSELAGEALALAA